MTDNLIAFIRKNGKTADSFGELKDMALAELTPMNGNAEIVCGPISTGGWGDIIPNFLVFNHAITALQEAGRPMWSQVPFEAGCEKLARRWEDAGNTGYCMPILTDFYEPLFSHAPRLIRRAWFIDGDRGWRTSKGAQWEHEKMKERGIEIQYFPHSWHRRIPDLSHLD